MIREKIVTPAAILDRIDKSGIEWPSVYRDDRELALSRARNWLVGVANRPVSRLTNRAMHPPGITVDYSAIVGGLGSGLAAAAQPNPRSVSRLLRRDNPSGRDDHNELDAERAPKSAEHGYDVTD
ncbi:hypothetical protein [Rhodococcus sp. ARC_M6]|uniref:hypothetical protein n=1 Tax=Rhodococcus sp. ARC_M6 TaxID=2928852 RepID=UPI001FB1B02F|nr:hypothetical protein [Rhodococcus sp. ARC_M6]MCJ0907471.1 hypothetical protein [Rhodococcus sp. ARC_M6]